MRDPVRDRFVELHPKLSSSCLGVSHFSSSEEDELCDTLESAFAKCEGDGDVVGVITPLRGVAQVVLHVVEVGVRLRVLQDRGMEEDGEGQDEAEREEGEVREKRSWMACGWDEDSRTC